MRHGEVADDLPRRRVDRLQAFRIRVCECALDCARVLAALGGFVGPVFEEEVVDGELELGGVEELGDRGEVGGCDRENGVR